MLVASGRVEELTALLDSAAVNLIPISRARPPVELTRQVRLLYKLAALAGADVDVKAAAAAGQLLERFENNASGTDEIDLWALAIWDLGRKNVARAAVIRETLRTRATLVRWYDTETEDRAQERRRRADLLARSLSAHIALAEGRTARALELFQSLAPTARRPYLTFRPWEGLGKEWMALAELRFARGDYAEAIDVAANLDAPGSVPNLIYLPASLALRMRAARELGNESLAERFRARLVAIGRDDLARSSL
jgi:tetratricopeptide (TPR) repeat protein